MNSAASNVVFDLSISADDYLRFYKGMAKYVLVRARDGRTVQFPANVLRRFVDGDGVRGSFRLRYDDRGKLVSLERIGDIGEAWP